MKYILSIVLMLADGIFLPKSNVQDKFGYACCPWRLFLAHRIPLFCGYFAGRNPPWSCLPSLADLSQASVLAVYDMPSMPAGPSCERPRTSDRQT